MLYRDQRHALMRFFARYRATPDDAHDLVQETFLRLSDSNATKTGLTGPPEAYLRTIARNLLRNRAKAARRHSDALHEDITDQPVPAACEVRRLEARDSLQRLEAVMMKLKPKTREIFMAHRLDGLTYKEIAEITGLSVKGVEKQMHKALVHIDRWMGRP
ncbi:MAG: RNA polymerase sigma factor [Pseudomonadota bacterium]|nr:RNA polymerase sigma factor [Pseudomonadota bacterium]